MKKQRNNKQKNKWFIAVRGSYLPLSWQAWLLYVPFTAYLIASLKYTSIHQSSVFGVVSTVFPQWIAAAVVMTWIAKRHS